MALSKYTSYSVRLQTLRNFPCGIDTRNVAKAGLYYINNRDNTDGTLRCAFCEFVVAKWTGADDPWELHAAFVPMCIHVLAMKGLEFVQKILQKDGCCGEAPGSAADIGMYARRLKPQDLTITGISSHLQSKQHSASASPSSQSGSASVYRTYRGVQFKLPVNLDMQDEGARARSFTTMDRLIKEMLNLEVLVEAGFYFTGQGDSVKCYYCGEGFKNWKGTDNPWVQHAKYAPSCMHVILIKGEEFVERIQRELERMPTFAGRVGGKRTRSRRCDFVDDADDVPNQGMKRLRIHGLPESCGVERGQLSTNGPPRDSGDVRCFKCQRLANRSTAVGAVCSGVWTCESCNIQDRQCPVCDSI